MVTEAKEYDMRRQEDVERWFREMHGYLVHCDFVNAGTDFDGRRFAMNGFNQLRDILCNNGKELEYMYKHGETK